ncbi:MAG: hypothetical protein K8T26_00380 [Lentisphaerae bacterium]|nr:hypothetical protein [Lentisphaerota bacterium]
MMRSDDGETIDFSHRLYRDAPPLAQRALRPLKALLRWRHLARMSFVVLTGTLEPGHLPLSILCAARPRGLAYLKDLYFDGACTERPLGRTSWWNARRLARRSGQDCPLMVAELSDALCHYLHPRRWFCIPTWIRGAVNLPLPSWVLQSSSVKSDLRRIRKNGLTYDVTRDPQRFADFYANMYVPHVSAIHGASTYLVPQAYMAQHLKDGDLLMVRKGEADIAGCLIVYDPDGPRLWSLGIRPADGDAFLTDGASGALYHFAFEYLAAKGYTRAGLGLSRAFLNDGILRYKRKWGQRIIGADPNRFALRILHPSPAVARILQEHPFVFTQGTGLYSAVFQLDMAPQTDEELRGALERNSIDGLAGLVLYRHPQAGPVSPGAIPPELSGRLSVRTLNDGASAA